MYLLEAPDEHHPVVQGGVGGHRRLHRGGGRGRPVELPHPHRRHRRGHRGLARRRRPRNVRVTDLLEEVEEERWVREGAGTAGSWPVGDAARTPRTTGVVAVATGDGIGRIFRSLGVQGLIAGGQSMNPSTAELVEAVEASGPIQVIILPNNGNIRPVAERVDDLTTKSVWVVPTDTIAEGFAALLAYDPEADGS
jgi:dihydroxyacetone kinase-like predicted kinase